MGCGPSHAPIEKDAPPALLVPPYMQSLGSMPAELNDTESTRPNTDGGGSLHSRGTGRRSTDSSTHAKRAGMLHHLVSKKKTRFQQDGFDLDLAYITPRLVAMGFPSTGTEAWYRNPADQVRLFIERYHAHHAKVYNLCGEPDREYDAQLLGLPAHLVERFIAFDHNPCPLFCIEPFCKSVADWLAQDEANVALIHCKAGKGRTGMLICCFLVWSAMYASATEAMGFYGKMRTSNGKGVTIPSQRRYVGYSEQLQLHHDALTHPPILLLDSVALLHAPDWGSSGFHFEVELVQLQGQPYESAPCPDWRCWVVFDSRKPTLDPRQSAWNESTMSKDRYTSFTREQIANAVLLNRATGAHQSTISEFDLEQRASRAEAPEVDRPSGEGVVLMTTGARRIPLAGDVKVSIFSPKGKMAVFWFHTAFVSNGKLRLMKAELDKACKEKKLYRDDFGVEVFCPSCRCCMLRAATVS
ncbi:hypothetical protein AB1Y20_019228 [Prymnesium parvum]|uniref:Phosphatidylinositol-3,4,5-trisphosphate 3-phosphatase n=1 Tax=Prymnesium parvum TaxID=97485 RepID=A0AB34JRY0_PRYPA